MPTAAIPGSSRRVDDHTGWTIESAIEQDDVGYPFRLDPPVIIKTAVTDRMASAKGFAHRRAIAAALYAALTVVDGAAVREKKIVVYDDVFTTGSTLNAVACRLMEAGAREVYGLTLARAPWR